MSKSTKIIAALGVVAGLGVAALPLSSYAATTSGNVLVQAQITDSIAMRIHSNADAAENTYTEVQEPSGNPSTQGWYERSGEAPSYTYTLSEDTEVDNEKTYYSLSPYYGVFKVNPDGTQNATDILAAGPSQATGLSLAGNQFNYDTLYSNISVRSNTGNFTLTVQDADATNDLDLAEASEVAGNFIPSVSGTNQGLVRTTAGWGYYVGTIADATAASGNIWNEVPTTGSPAATIAAAGTNSVGAFSDDIHVAYGVASGATKTGTYSDTIVYTATNN